MVLICAVYSVKKMRSEYWPVNFFSILVKSLKYNNYLNTSKTLCENPFQMVITFRYKEHKNYILQKLFKLWFCGEIKRSLYFKNQKH